MAPDKPGDIENDEEGETGTVTRKPGSKAQGRTRTKTGCLSEFPGIAPGICPPSD